MKHCLFYLGLSIFLTSTLVQASEIPESATTKEGVRPFAGCSEYMNCEVLAEEGRYQVIQTQAGRDCESGGIWAVNLKSGRAVLMPGITNCDFDSTKNAVVIYPKNGFATIYQGANNATPELSTVELPDE
ncbi:hypothetical protein [Citrobacter amalonaticus]|uniref:DUF1496 domain-containing protein n=1 Tax=Citrobacter amalonaticus TaxID=35703 RepID=A0A8I0T2W4_CITAM|nr:hypothetical protein [Citrobacter amalonaticus]MBE0131175.1 hypothetical protein [Citrobacter amalonaticus]